MKRSNKLKKFFFKAMCLLVFTMLIGRYAYPVKIEFIKNPKPTHFEQEKHYKKLTLVKKISADFDEEYFLAQPGGLVVDDEGNIFIADRKIHKVFKFSKDFKFIKNFGSTGMGPGEYYGYDYFPEHLYFAPDSLLYLCSSNTKKLIAYNKDGKFVKEVPVPEYQGGYVPIVDSSGNVYLPSREGAVVVYNKERRKVHTYLDNSVYRTFILMKPFEDQIFINTKFNSYNTHYDLLPDSRFIIYISNSSTVYIFKGKDLEKKIRIWPKEEIKHSLESLERVRKLNKNKNWIALLFNNFFIDGDNRKFFYLETGFKDKKMLYKFSLDGDLVSILWIDSKMVDVFKVKKNNLFFGMTFDGDVKIMQEEIK